MLFKKTSDAKIQKSFTKPKIKFIKSNHLKKIFNTHKLFNMNFFDQHNIEVALHKYVWQNW